MARDQMIDKISLLPSLMLLPGGAVLQYDGISCPTTTQKCGPWLVPPASAHIDPGTSLMKAVGAEGEKASAKTLPRWSQVPELLLDLLQVAYCRKQHPRNMTSAKGLDRKTRMTEAWCTRLI